MSDDNARGGIGFTGLLTVVFIVLKLIGVITWSWLWVLAPIWIPVGIMITILLVMGIIVFIASIASRK